MKLFGSPIAEKIKSSLVQAEKPQGKLAVVQVGDNPVSSLYVRKKQEFAADVGVDSIVVIADSSNAEKIVGDLANDQSVSGIIVQLPIPADLKREQLLKVIPKEKDIDGFRYILSEDYISVPPTVLAISSIFEYYNISLEDGVLIIGEGFLVGSPLKRFLLEKGIKVKVLQKNEPEYEEILKSFNVVVVATGGGRFFQQSEFKPGAYVIDASTVQEENKLRGDVSTEGDLIHLSPVPGGVGPITVAMLFRNFFRL